MVCEKGMATPRICPVIVTWHHLRGRPTVPSHNSANTNAIRQIYAGRRQASPTIVSEHVQFVRDLSCDCVFLVIGYDEFVGAEDPQHRIIYALLQGQKSVDKPFSRRIGHMFASHVHVIEIGLRGIENADFGGI